MLTGTVANALRSPDLLVKLPKPAKKAKKIAIVTLSVGRVRVG